MSRVADALDHMQRAIAKIQRYAPPDRAAFDANELIRESIERNLISLGEAANRIPKEFHAAHPEIPWSKIIGMRHILTHDYDEIDPDIVWNVVVNELPRVREALGVVRAKVTQDDGADARG